MKWHGQGDDTPDAMLRMNYAVARLLFAYDRHWTTYEISGRPAPNGSGIQQGIFDVAQAWQELRQAMANDDLMWPDPEMEGRHRAGTEFNPEALPQRN